MILHLLEIHCLSILSYAIEVIDVADQGTCRKLRVAYISIFRQIFGYRKSHSVTDLQHQLGRPSLEESIAERKESFTLNLIAPPPRLPLSYLLCYMIAHVNKLHVSISHLGAF